MQLVIFGGTAQPEDHWHHLGRWWERPFNCGDTPTKDAVFDRHSRIVAVEPHGPPVPNGPFARVAQAIMRYDIFPPHIGSGLLKHTPVQLGDAVGLRYRFLPGLELVFASRVIEIIDEECRQGFVYRTLKWHPEKGQETFQVRKDPGTGEVRASLEAWSAPGLLLTSLVYHLGRKLQLAAGRAALDHMEGIAQSFQSPT